MHYRELDVYKRSYKLALEMHDVSKRIPKELQYDLGDQLRRASRSVPANIAEGCARRVEEAIRKLVRELEFFRTGSREDREVFRQNISAQDVGYTISFLKALFDEDAFQNWIFAAQYDMGRNSKIQKGKIQ